MISLTMDRLTHRFPMIETKRESHRLQEARRSRLGVEARRQQLSVDTGPGEG